MTEPLRLLLIDDDPMQRELVERALSGDGFDVRAVETLGALAAEAARRAPDIVLVDVDLPGVRPEQALRAAREAAPGARIVVYSAWDESRLRALARQAGADAFLSKSESVLALGPKLRELRARPGAAS